MDGQVSREARMPGATSRFGRTQCAINPPSPPYQKARAWTSAKQGGEPDRGFRKQAAGAGARNRRRPRAHGRIGRPLTPTDAGDSLG
jgi:hypothetical protein